MKTYVSHKEIQATPAWKIDGKIYPKDKELPETVYYKEDGYQVTYKESTPFWISASVFPSLYVSVETPVEKLCAERNLLYKKYEKERELITNQDFRHIITEDYQAFLLIGKAYHTSRSFLYTQYQNDYAYSSRTKELTMPFHEALVALSNGFPIRRLCWINKHNVLIHPMSHKSDLTGTSCFSKEAQKIVDKYTSETNCLDTCVLFNTATGSTEGWLPIGEDLFASDWVVATESPED